MNLRKRLVSASLLLTLLLGCQQEQTRQETSAPVKMSVDQRLQKARAAKALKRQTGSVPAKATPADYQTPTVKQPKGPNGEAVHVGERGALFYINKNGNKTYLSSNQ